MNITATNKATGEIVELPANTPQEIVDAWRIAQEYDKTATALKNQLKMVVPELINEKGVSEPVGAYQFRVSSIQRKTYDKSVMREVLDADTFDTLLVPDKPLIDRYLKENLETLGDVSTQLRTSMVDAGAPYSVTKLEKISRDA